ncbi:uncharacterized protein LOC114316071 isoform X3 [Camellia sinensis]|uniref:uncharacterized protein LOC114316071 isoform X3 n=1 Tax=Camellia sinensis TaxID=4442 RepID=UPI001035B15A|nr:uncharacterized protein LOC114316071 isoform X3 [Camellia sinensis]
MVSIIAPFQKWCWTKCHNGIAKMRFVISVLLFLVFILFGVPFVLYSTKQVLLIAPTQIKSDRTKYYLLASFVLHIKHSESKDSAVSPRILLSGPAGNQLRSDCSDVPIIQALQRGVRVFELDIWPNSTKDNVNVLHGRKLWPTSQAFRSF